MTTESKTVVLYKRGKITSAGVTELRKAGYAVVAIDGEFSDVQFRMTSGIAFEDEMGDMQLMVLKAALGSLNFDGRLGTLVTNALKKKLADAEAKRNAPSASGD